VSFAKCALIVGSGPAGVAAAMKLQSLGISTMMIDTNLNDSDEYLEINPEVAKKRKLIFGSDYPYRHFNFGPKITLKGAGLPCSFAQGGFSTLWGASFLPFSRNDISHWPIDLDGLKLGYEFVASKVPISSTSNRKLVNYDDYQNQRNLKPDQVFRLTDSSMLHHKNLEIGGSRLTVRTSMNNNSDCIHCGKCLSGCGIGSIWSSKDELNALIKGGLMYLSGERVLVIRSNRDDFSVDTISKDGSVRNIDGFSKVFLAAGNVETFRILARSGMVDTFADVQHSTTFYFPSIISKRKLYNTNNFGLSQVFIRLQNDSKESEAHFQLYSLSNEMFISMTKRIPIFKLIPLRIRSKLMSKIVMSIGYTNAEHISALKFALMQNGDCEIQGEFLSSRRVIKKNLRRKVLRSNKAFRKLGLITFSRFLVLGLPGDGVHAGGWLVSGDKCDDMGSPVAQKGVHVIDSSVLPSIPDGPITFTIMANAVRIVSEVYK
jgi:hypothetical protein